MVAAFVTLKIATLTVPDSNGPAAMPDKLTVCGVAVPRGRTLFAIGSITGGSSLPGAMTTVSVCWNVPSSAGVAKLLSRPPSSTVTVIVNVPTASCDGVKFRKPVVGRFGAVRFNGLYVTVGFGIASGVLLTAVTFSC